MPGTASPIPVRLRSVTSVDRGFAYMTRSTHMLQVAYDRYCWDGRNCAIVDGSVVTFIQNRVTFEQGMNHVCATRRF
jgi:hypothetical protein